MKYSIKYRIYPNKIQKKFLIDNIEANRIMWNLLLNDYKRKLEHKKDNEIIKLPTYFEIINQHNEFKILFKLAIASSLSSTRNDLFRIINKNSNEEKKKSLNFKLSEYNYLSFKFFNRQKNNIIIENSSANNHKKHKMIIIPKIGPIRLLYHREIPNNAEIKEVIVTHDITDKWYVTLNINEDEFKYKYTQNQVNDYIEIDNDEIYNLVNKYYKKYNRKLKLAQMKRSFMIYNSKNDFKQRQKIFNIQKKIFNHINNDLHHYSKSIIEKNKIVIINNQKNNEFNILKNQLKHKAIWYQRNIVVLY